MTFATLPPEINSGRMCTGPGSGSMTEAAAAWDKLAAQLYARLADYRSVTRDITGFAPVSSLARRHRGRGCARGRPGRDGREGL